MPNILKREKYDGVVGVACGSEVILSGKKLNGMGVVWQSVPLLKELLCQHIFQHGIVDKNSVK